MSNVAALQSILKQPGDIVFFGGAGVSTESGIPDFRSQDGLYSQSYAYPPEVMLSHSFYQSHKDEFFAFYKEKILQLDALPNPAHQQLALWEKAGRVKAVITQNIDGLHQKAGSQNVIELHGSVHRNYCETCHRHYPAAYVLQSKGAPICACGGPVKPDVVLYEEALNSHDLQAAATAIAAADVLIIGGTSLVVYPAAGLVQYFKGRNLVVINKTAVDVVAGTCLHIGQPIGEVFSQIEL